MRRTLPLLATAISFALLLVVGAVAASQQRQEQGASPQSPTTVKSEGDFSVQSTNVKASFTSGSGSNRLSVAVSNHGNLISFESPANQEAVFAEGYAVCSNVDISSGGYTGHGYDAGPAEAGFGAPTFAQPTAGKFPLTVTRNTTDGKFQLKQVWNKPDATEKDATVTMTLTNRTSATINNVGLTRTGDFDVGPSSSDRVALTGDSAWMWDDANGGPDTPAVGLGLTALSFGTSRWSYVSSRSDWNAFLKQGCDATTVETPTIVGDWTMSMLYTLGNLNAGQSKTVKFVYGRM